MTLVVILTIRTEALDSFRAFERKAAEIMARHGGNIERTVVIPSANGSELMKEIHIVTFPDQRSFQAYRNDDALRDVAYLRDESVVETEILVGEDGPDYKAIASTREGTRKNTE